MRIYALMENTPYAPQFAAEHGLSLYIETDRHRGLRGQRGAAGGGPVPGGAGGALP